MVVPNLSVLPILLLGLDMSRLIGVQERMEIGDLALDGCTAIRVAHERVPRLQLNRLGNGLYVAVLTQGVAHTRHTLMLQEAQPA